ncbi:MAG: PA2779 family protein [Proteobacteria bacterium]|nr:PA2779 family protein [Pseudomonadota bacterium]
MKRISLFLVFVMFFISIVPRVEAGFCPSESFSKHSRVTDMNNIQNVLEIKLIRERLSQLGLTQNGINDRLSQLNDNQIHQLALNIDDLRIGGNGFEFLVVILLIGILVGIWFYVTDHKVNISRR